MAAESNITTDPTIIQKWAEERDGKPSTVKGTGSDSEVGLLRINFPGGAEDTLVDITWEEFFQKFEENKPAFLYQEKTAAGKLSRFNKIINRDTAEKSKASNSKASGGNRKPAASKGTSKTTAKSTSKSKSATKTKTK